MPGIGHNGGPVLPQEHEPEWGEADPFVYFAWKRAYAKAWKGVPWETMLRRQARADAVGLSYEEYTLELLERGRYLGEADEERIGAIKARRARPAIVGRQTETPATLPDPAIGRRRA